MKEEIEPTFPMVMATVSTVLAYNDCTVSWWCLVAFISGCAARAYMTPLFKLLTEQHGAEAPLA